MKLTTIPFRNAFPRIRWAQLPVFDGYLAVIPAEGNARAKTYHQARRANLRRVLQCAIDELEHGTGGPDVEKLLARLRRINLRKVRLPGEVRIVFRERLTTTNRTGDHRGKRMKSVRFDGPFTRLVRIQDLIDLGLRGAIAARRGAHAAAAESEVLI